MAFKMGCVIACLPRPLVSGILLLSLLCYDVALGRAIYTPPNTSNSRRSGGAITPYSAADIKALWGKRWNLSRCSVGIKILVGGKMINTNSFYCTKSDAVKLAPMLSGENLPDRAYVWCRMALLYHSLSTNVKIFDVEKLNLFDGDIILNRENVDAILATFYPTPSLQYAAMDSARKYQRQRSRQRPKRKAVADASLMWDNARVPFSMEDIRFSKQEKEVIYEAISQWERSTCVRFLEQRQRSFQPHIYFKRAGGCSSSFGKQSTGQFIYMGDGCDVVGIAAHEIGHALGFYHEHARPDRDRYVTVITDNVQERYHRQFVKSEWINAKTFGIPYDYSSVLHYSSSSFAEEKLSIVTKDPEMQKVIGQREGLSFFDIKMANTIYCSESCQGSSLEWSECKHGGYRNPNNCSSCLCPRGLAPPRCENPAPGVKANCERQTLEASGSSKFLSSPGYSGSGFPAGGFCSWVIKVSSPGMQIKLQFSGDFDFTDEDENNVCYDYVEVRYKGLERAGPRFCGKARPAKTFISHGEEVLLFITTDPLSSGKQGFRVTYSEERCGGCSVGASSKEAPCLRVVKFDCGPRKEENTCYREESFCCDGYHLQGDKCVAGGFTGPVYRVITHQPVTTTTRRTTTTTTTPPSFRAFNIFRYFTRPPRPPPPAPRVKVTSTWGPWSAWTPCSATCGLCGTQHRQRSCQGKTCSGQPFEVRKCGTSQCPFETVSKATVCLTPGCPWTNPACFRTCYRLATKPRCCVGYPRGNICQR